MEQRQTLQRSIFKLNNSFWKITHSNRLHWNGRIALPVVELWPLSLELLSELTFVSTCICLYTLHQLIYKFVHMYNLIQCNIGFIWPASMCIYIYILCAYIYIYNYIYMSYMLYIHDGLYTHDMMHCKSELHTSSSSFHSCSYNHHTAYHIIYRPPRVYQHYLSLPVTWFLEDETLRVEQPRMKLCAIPDVWPTKMENDVTFKRLPPASLYQ